MSPAYPAELHFHCKNWNAFIPEDGEKRTTIKVLWFQNELSKEKEDIPPWKVNFLSL